MAQKGRALIDLGRHNEAVEVLTAAAALDPDYDLVHYRLGNAYFLLEDHEKALVAYERAVALEPDDGPYLLPRGRVIGAMARYEAAPADLLGRSGARRNGEGCVRSG